MSNNAVAVWLFAFVTIWAVLFAGEPDVMDIIVRHAGTEEAP